MPCQANASSKNAIKQTNTKVIHSSRLDLDGALKCLALLLLAGVGLGTHDTTSPVALALLVLLGVTLLDGLDQLGELRLILRADLSDGEDSGGL